MKTEQQRALEARVASLWQEARPKVQERLAQLRRGVQELREVGLSPTTRDACVAAAHQLAGSLGVFGMVRASAVAGLVESMFAGLPESGAQTRSVLLAECLEQIRMDVEHKGPRVPQAE